MENSDGVDVPKFKTLAELSKFIKSRFHLVFCDVCIANRKVHPWRASAVLVAAACPPRRPEAPCQLQAHSTISWRFALGL
jgi:hypothetical protein